MSDYREHLAQFKRDMDNPPPAITPEQVAADWQAGHDQDFPAVFGAEERARAKAYVSEQALTLEYISRLERIAEAAFDYWSNSPSVNDFYRNDLYDALKAVDLHGE